MGSCQLSGTRIQGAVLGLVVVPGALLYPSQCVSSHVVVMRLCQGVSLHCNACLGATSVNIQCKCQVGVRGVNIQKYKSIFFHL